MAWLNWIGVGALFAALSVAFGAFGAHGLKAKVSLEDLAIFETGAKYHMYHSLGLIFIGLVMAKIDTVLMRVSGFAMAGGIVVFSGSLYALVLTQNRWLGAITPIGGGLLILSWLLLA